MNAVTKIQTEDQRKAVISVLQQSLYPGARQESVEMVLGYCQARGLDPMLKPVHIVPMWIKDATSGQGGMRDVVLPGIALYRIQAARTGSYIGKSEPEFGPDETKQLGSLKVTFPKWCKVTVKRLVNGKECDFAATEYWLENYANAGKDKEDPNAMWKKRAYGQLAKCAEAQALRMAFPEETGGDATAEEMEGKVQGPIIDHDAIQSAIPQARPGRRPEAPIPEIPDWQAPTAPAPDHNAIMESLDMAETLEDLQATLKENWPVIKAMPEATKNIVMTCYNGAKHGFEHDAAKVASTVPAEDSHELSDSVV